MKIFVQTDSVRTINSKDKTTGAPKSFRLQEVFLKKSFETVTRQAKIFLENDQPPYQPGEYEFDVERSLEIRNDRLGFGNLVLKPSKIDNSGTGAK